MTHKGAEADAGHYIGFVKKRALHRAPALPAGLSTLAAVAGLEVEVPARPTLAEDDEDWYKQFPGGHPPGQCHIACELGWKDVPH